MRVFGASACDTLQELLADLQLNEEKGGTVHGGPFLLDNKICILVSREEVSTADS